MNRLLLKILWSIGGQGDAIDGLPRVRGPEISTHLDLFEPGDLLLLGNSGVASHVAVYVGQGSIVHSMATEKTMRGWFGSVWDALWRPWRWMRGTLDQTGVMEEPLAGFLNRFERDTWISLRADVDEEQRDAGILHIRSLIGKAYDYAFEADDDTYYCTEIVTEFLNAALKPSERPTFETRKVRVPGLLNTHVVEPVALLGTDKLTVIAANGAARSRYGEHLETATVV
jgi:hypothetical protein